MNALRDDLVNEWLEIEELIQSGELDRKSYDKCAARQRQLDVELGVWPV